jgi:predicted metal-dependent peptidase
MGYIQELREALGVKKDQISLDTDLTLSTVRTLITKERYNVGKFFYRLLSRIDLVDNFTFDAIAAASFNPTIRKITILINPFLMWDHILRPTVIHTNIPKTQVGEMDRLLLDSLKDGGWTTERFAQWIGFMTDETVISKKSGQYDNDRHGHDNNFTSSFLSVILHEVCHIIWNHTSPQRREDTEKTQEEQMFGQILSNIAQDFAINQTLRFGILDEMFMTTVNKSLLYAFYTGGANMSKNHDEESVKKITEKNINISMFDHILFLNQPYEYYLDLLKKADPDAVEKVAGKKLPSSMGMEGEGDGPGFYDLFKHTLGNLSKEDKEKLQAILNGEGEEQFEDFNQMGADAKKVAANDLKRVIDEMLEKGEINDPRDICEDSPFKINKYFTKVIDNLYPTETISWEHILAHYVRKALGCEDHSYSMKRESRSIPEMFPGKDRLEGLEMNIVVDVSGSICHDEFNRFMNEVERIAREVDVPQCRYMQFHSNVALDEVVMLNNIRNMGISSTGGTHLASALDRLKNDCNRALTVVFTDGYVEEETKAADYDYEIILFLSSSGRGYASSSLRSRGFIVVHQDGDNSWFNDA